MQDIKKITSVLLINSKSEEMNLWCGSLKLEKFNIDHSRKISSVNLSHGSFSKDVNIFQDEVIKVSGQTSSSLVQFKKFIRGFNEIFEMKIKYGNDDDYFCKVMIKSDSVIFSKNMCWENLEIEFVRVTHFYKKIEYSYDLSLNPVIEKGKYPYAYPIKYTGRSHTYDSGYIDIFNDGHLPSPMNIKIYGLAEQPTIGVNALASSTMNAFVFIGTVEDSAILELDTFDVQLKIEKDSVNVQNFKDDSKLSYIQAPNGSSRLFLHNISKMEVILYELYYSI